jgi:hypothetical protein
MTNRILLVAFLSACSASGVKPAPGDDFSDVGAAGAGDKTDSFKNMKVVATLGWNQTTAPFAYTKTPKYRVVKISANLGDHLDAWVRSPDGDAVAWLLDGSYHVLATNDDASDDTLDAHLVFDFGPTRSATYYIAVRDYAYASVTFTVEADGGPLLKECAVDADCVRVTASCCGGNNDWDAVRQGDEQEFHTLLACPAHQVCPLFVIADDHAMAECDATTNLCQAVKPRDIVCGGFVRNAHACPAGWSCLATKPDRPGSCVQECSAGCDLGTSCDEASGLCR